jgi:molybdopterin converting factor small subunit
MKVELSTVSLSRDDGPDATTQEQGERTSLDLPEGATVADVLQQIEQRQRSQVQKVLVNGVDAADETRLNDGDAIALVGQTSGM